MKADINYKTYYDKVSEAWKLKQAVYVNVWQPKADHRGIKVTEYRWIGPPNIEKNAKQHLFGTKNESR